MSEKTSSVHYINYLALDKILDSQYLVSKEKEMRLMTKCFL